MSDEFVIKRDSGGRPTEGGLRLPGRDASDRPDQPAKSIALKVGLRQTSDGRITKPNNSAGNRKRHGKANLSKVPASKGHGLQVSNHKKSDKGSLHDMFSRDKSLGREAILEAHKKPVSEPSVESVATEFIGFDLKNLSGNWKSKGHHRNKACDNVQSDAGAATPTIQPTHSPDFVQHGIINDHSHGTEASIQGTREKDNAAPHSNFGHNGSLASHHGESAPPDADRIRSTGPAASVGL